MRESGGMGPDDLAYELSSRLATIDGQITRLADEREAVRVLLERLTPEGQADHLRSNTGASGAIRRRLVELMNTDEVVDTATMTARLRARGEVVSSKSVGNSLARLATHGQLRRVGRGRYVLQQLESSG